MQQRILGTQGLSVSAIGLGCMGMSQFYGVADEAESIAVIRRALDLGVTFLDTAEVYGPFVNEELVGKALRGRRSEAVVATKFGFKINPESKTSLSGLDGTPENVRRAADASLGRLGIETIDLFYQHRRDPDVPIEETVGALKELVEAGKVRYIGLSEVGPETLRRAHAVHPISALQSEYSLWERGLEESVIPTLRELGIGLVPFSPLGRGFLTGTVESNANLPEDDYRWRDPRFGLENAKKNAAIVAGVKAIASAHAATAAQVALAWLLAKGGDIVPIPGTKRLRYLEENGAATELVLSEDEVRRLDALAAITAGPRYSEVMMSLVER
jgi:aryl-alcohol dehydrogenase-like predicted oxidoreductase